MEVAGDYTFDAPQDMVWDALRDPNVLGSVMPGGKGFEQTAENQYSGTLEVKVGPVQGTFQGQIKLSDLVPPQSYKIEVDGKGATGFVKATGSLLLEPHDAQTSMKYSGQAQVGGRIASVGQRLIDSAARSIIRQSLEAMNAYLKAQVALKPAAAIAEPELVAVAAQAAAAGVETPKTAAVAASASTPPPAPAPYKAPSQTALAFNIARDVFNDMVPKQYQPLLIMGVMVVIVLIIWLIVRR